MALLGWYGSIGRHVKSGRRSGVDTRVWLEVILWVAAQWALLQ